jgi:predicted aldo/keto reductase-like oxidoreductase
MPYSRKIVLICPHGATPRLETLVEKFIQDGIKFVAVVGNDCSRVEDFIDEIVVGDGTREFFLLTSSHPGETTADATDFARSLSGEYAGDEVQLVELLP